MEHPAKMRKKCAKLNFGLARLTIWSAQIGHVTCFFSRAEQLCFEMNTYGRTLHRGKSIEKDMRSLIIDILSGGGNVSTEYCPGSFKAIGSKYKVSGITKRMEGRPFAKREKISLSILQLDLVQLPIKCRPSRTYKGIKTLSRPSFPPLTSKIVWR